MTSTNSSFPIVYIIEDDTEVCEALNWLLKSVDLKTKTYHDSSAFLLDFNPNSQEGCGCILLDIRMPKLSGLQLQQELNHRHNHLPIIFLTGHGDISMAVNAMRSGAFDFITKPFNNQMLLEQIQKAIIHCREIQSKSPHKSHELTSKLKQLTVREKEILEYIIAGKMNKEIASDLNIALSTVELHRSKVMRKLEVKNIVELVKNYMRTQDCNV